jgi:DNA repair protein RecN (Recombination protein N)
MLRSLSIRDVVLIDRLDLELTAGLGVLTGETGAGKSILLDSLGLVLGDRSDSGLVRAGAAQASVTASFELGGGHAALALLDEQGIEAEDLLVLRRTVSADGRSRAFVNDQPVSVGLLKALGGTLVEIHGQHGQQGFLEVRNHRPVLDAFGGLTPLADTVRGLYGGWQKAHRLLEEARARLAELKREEDYLRQVMAEREELLPEPGEEDRLAEERQLLMHGEKIIEGINEAASTLGREDGAERSLRLAIRVLERVCEQAGGRLDPVIQGLDRASVELAEAWSALEEVGRGLDIDPSRLERVEERLFALRAAARKHAVQVDQLPDLLADFAAKLAALDAGEQGVEDFTKAVAEARAAYVEAARELSVARQTAAGRLDAAVARELPPLKMDKATFRTRLEPLDEANWTADGAERVSFEVSTNPGAPMGPLARIASGGELSRFVLALKVALADTRSAGTLIFDEVDQGVGGAVAAAVGARLAQLADNAQILVVTHSPQVAALGSAHWRVAKESGGEVTLTSVARLGDEARLEEIARMLAGAEITSEARAAAASLLQR